MGMGLREYRGNGDNNSGIPAGMGMKATVIPWGWGYGLRYTRGNGDSFI